MIEKASVYTLESEDLFEHIIKEEKFEYNHVVIKPGFKFPAHPTDAKVVITVISGELAIKLEEQDTHYYKKGSVVQVNQGVVSVLGNESIEPCEVFVIKRR